MVWILKSITRPESLSFSQGYPVAADRSVMPGCEWGAEISAVLA